MSTLGSRCSRTCITCSCQPTFCQTVSAHRLPSLFASCIHTLTDKRLVKIPCLAIKSTLRCNFREPNPQIIYATPITDFALGPTPHLFLVEHTILDAIRRRYRPYRIPRHACLSRRYDHLPPSFPIPYRSILIPQTADGLDRFEVPFFGGLASSFVDSE